MIRSAGHSVQVEVCRTPVFVIGAERSGTTILALSLGQHSELWYSCEGHFFPGMFDRERVDRVYERGLFRYRWIQEEEVTRQELLESLGLGINALFMSRSGGKRWIEKTPQNTLLVDVLAEMFPGASFVHILRDGRQVVSSMANFLNGVDEETRSNRVHTGSGPRWATDFTAACRTWRQYVTTAMEFQREHPDRCLTVQYDSLVARSEESFGEIFRFIDVPFEQAPVDFFRSTRINSSFGHGTATPSREPWTAWTPEEQRIFLEEAGETMARYGLPGEPWQSRDEARRA